MSLSAYVIYVLPFLLVILAFGAAGMSILVRRRRAAGRQEQTQAKLDNSGLLPSRRV